MPGNFVFYIWFARLLVLNFAFIKIQNKEDLRNGR